MSRRHALLIDDNRIWIRHRGHIFGPFDYEWSPDFCGAEFHYAGRKFGEFCSVDEIFVDSSELGVPRTVSQIAVVAIASTICGVLAGEESSQRLERIQSRLIEFGFDRYLPVEIPNAG